MNAIKDSIKSGRTVVGTTVTPNVDMSILADAGYAGQSAQEMAAHEARALGSSFIGDIS